MIYTIAVAKTKRGEPQPNRNSTRISGISPDSECSIRTALGKRFSTEANEGNEEEFLLRFPRFRLFKKKSCEEPFPSSTFDSPSSLWLRLAALRVFGDFSGKSS